MASRLVDKQIGGHRVQGYSRAGEESVIVLPELNLCFDIGRAPNEAVSIDHVCLTHGHMDHAAGVAYYFSQRCFVGNSPGCVVSHPSLIEPLGRLMGVWAAMEGHPSPHKLVGLLPGEELEIRRGLLVRAFEVNHGGPCLGYSVIERRHKLKSEYAELSGLQLVALKKQGVDITRQLDLPLVAYCGDTAPGDFLDLDIVRNAQVLLLECTFYEADHVRRARMGKHVHVNDLPAMMDRLRNPQVVITHLTRRTGLGQAKRMLKAALRPEDWQRIAFLMDRPRSARVSLAAERENEQDTAAE